MRSTLDQIEGRIQGLVENSLGRLFPADELSRDLVVNLLAAMRRQTWTDELGQRNAPIAYTLYLHPQWLAGLPHQLNQDLIDLIQRSAAAEGLGLEAPPTITWSGNPSLAASEIQCVARAEDDDTRETRQVTSGQKGSEPRLDSAAMIDETNQAFQLHPHISTIGRDATNVICLAQLQVSRHHAQIRHQDGHFTLIDLGSSGGTTVNDLPIVERRLQTGDVIGLAGIPMIFVLEDPDEESEIGSTRRMGTS
jgi:hypothetical protein